MSTSGTQTGAVTGNALVWIRLEAAAMFAISMFLYYELGHPWWLYLALFLVPDLSIAGYLAGPRAGSACYNVAHSYVIPFVLLGLGLATDRLELVSLVCIWLGHIGFDRMLGYGLKYPSSFKDTHLGRLGKRQA
jgi:hypothetical protein